jgi:hypothetical protein
MGAYVRLYAFLSQIFDYGNTAIEKRFHLLQAPAARCWTSAASARGRPVQGGADPPHAEEQGSSRLVWAGRRVQAAIR